MLRHQCSVWDVQIEMESGPKTTGVEDLDSDMKS